MLENKHILVTGAGRGLGSAITSACLEAGAHVVAVDRDRERLIDEAARLDAPDRLTTAVCDIADERAVRRLFTDLEVVPWGIVNNAALADGVGGQPFWDLDLTDWRRIMSVNLDGLWLFSKHAAKSMVPVAEGRIVNIASDAALYGSPRLSHYVASKGGVIALTRTMARDLGPHGITANAVAPGLTVSPSAEFVPEHRHRLYAQNQAICREQVPEDLTGLVAFLLSDQACYITGQTIVVDGGFVMP